MQIYDQAHALAKAIKESDEFKQYKKLSEEIDNEPYLKTMIDDFHNRQLELQKEQLLNNKIDPEDEMKMHDLLDVISKDPKAFEFLNAEMKFAQIMGDVSKILSEL